MYYYKFNLFPLRPFFFGKELSAELGNRQNYYQSSMYFPQQSSLLGMVRYLLLLKNGLAKPRINEGKPDDYVGPKGFNPEGYDNNYGKIISLSPVFLQKNKTGHYFLFDKHRFIKNDHEYALYCSIMDGVYGGLHKSPQNKLPVLYLKNNSKIEPYSVKGYFIKYLVNLDDGVYRLTMDDVFKTAVKAGNEKSLTGEADSRAYYKFEFQYLGVFDSSSVIEKKNREDRKYRVKPVDGNFTLNPQWTFSFYLKTSEDVFQKDEGRIVTIGKEQSPFMLSIEVIDRMPEAWSKMENPAANSGTHQITFLSDAYIENESKLLECIIFGIIDTVRFRSFTRDISKNNFIKKPPFQKHALNLIKRGSILFTDEVEKAVSNINNEKFKTIGYNYFTINKME